PSLAGFFTSAGWIGEKDLRSDGKHGWVRKAVQERPQKTPIDDHIVVEKHDNVRGYFVDATIVSTGETIVPVEREDPHCRKVLSNEFHAPIGTAVIDDKDLVTTAFALDCFHHCRQAFLQQMPAVPADDHDRRAWIGRLRLRVLRVLSRFSA